MASPARGIHTRLEKAHEALVQLASDHEDRGSIDSAMDLKVAHEKVREAIGIIENLYDLV